MVGGCFMRRVAKSIILLNFIQAGVAEATARWDLTDSDMVERFFSSSQIAAAFVSTSNFSPRIEWTATTPIATACGSAVLFKGIDSNQWRFMFSDSMDPSVPSVDHVVSMSLDEDVLSQVVDISLNTTMTETTSNGSNDTMIFRLFAFLPYGKGTLVSRMYALELPLYLEEDDGTANASNDYSIPLPIYQLNYTDWVHSLWGNNVPEEAEYTSPTLPAPLFLMDHYGESPLAFSRGPGFSGDSSGEVTARLNNSMIEFHLEDEESQGGGDVAAAFHFGLDPLVDGSEGLSVEAFYATEGFADSGQPLHHGLARAQEVSEDPYAMISPSSLPLAAWDEPMTDIVAGAVWIDNKMKVQYSNERKTPLSDFNFSPPTQPPSGSTSGSHNDDHASNLCPPESIRNLALMSEGATIIAVSSNYGTTPAAVSSSFGAEKAIDGLENTAWSSAGDGNDAFVSIQLPFPSNLVYVEFHTRTMGSSAQIYSYQVEVSNDFDIPGGGQTGNVIASTCNLPDASRLYRCNFDHDAEDVKAKNVSVVTFRVVQSSGGNTGAVEVGVFGCSVDEEPLLTTDARPGTCVSDNDCSAKVRSRFPSQSSSGVNLCGCYAASSINPFDECEGKDDSTCAMAKCRNTCAELEANCAISLDSNDGERMCMLQPILNQPSPSPTSPESTLPMTGDTKESSPPTSAPIVMTKATPMPSKGSSETPLPTRETGDSTLSPIEAEQTISPIAGEGSLSPSHSFTTLAPIAAAQITSTPVTLAPIAGEGSSIPPSINNGQGPSKTPTSTPSSLESTGMILRVPHSIPLALLAITGFILV